MPHNECNEGVLGIDLFLTFFFSCIYDNVRDLLL